mgnify:CR=1 FL=1
MGKIFYLMGKSSSGKDTIYKELIQKFPKMKRIVLYTTRPRREGERDGVEYFFTDEEKLQQFRNQGQLIEERSYHTQYGVWSYFTADDGQINLGHEDYLVIGTLESYRAMKEYFGAESLVPLYIEVEDGLRLTRALEREKRQSQPRYDELCRRFLADSKDFSEENLRAAGIEKRFRMWIWRSASKPLKGKLGGVTSHKIVVY